MCFETDRYRKWLRSSAETGYSTSSLFLAVSAPKRDKTTCCSASSLTLEVPGVCHHLSQHGCCPLGTSLLSGLVLHIYEIYNCTEIFFSSCLNLSQFQFHFPLGLSRDIQSSSRFCIYDEKSVYIRYLKCVMSAALNIFGGKSLPVLFLRTITNLRCCQRLILLFCF